MAGVDVVFLVRKSLDNWLWSIRRYPTSQLRSRKRRNLFDGEVLNEDRATALYHDFYSAWGVWPGDVEQVKYEDVLRDTTGWLLGVQDKYGLVGGGEWDTVPTGHLWAPGRKERYLEHA
jgi:hypothetical protein